MAPLCAYQRLRAQGLSCPCCCTRLLAEDPQGPTAWVQGPPVSDSQGGPWVSWSLVSVLSLPFPGCAVAWGAGRVLWHSLWLSFADPHQGQRPAPAPPWAPGSSCPHEHSPGPRPRASRRVSVMLWSFVHPWTSCSPPVLGWRGTGGCGWGGCGLGQMGKALQTWWGGAAGGRTI